MTGYSSNSSSNRTKKRWRKKHGKLFTSNGSKLTHSTSIAWPTLIHFYLHLLAPASFRCQRIFGYIPAEIMTSLRASQQIWHPDYIQFHHLNAKVRFSALNHSNGAHALNTTASCSQPFSWYVYSMRALFGGKNLKSNQLIEHFAFIEFSLISKHSHRLYFGSAPFFFLHSNQTITGKLTKIA